MEHAFHRSTAHHSASMQLTDNANNPTLLRNGLQAGGYNIIRRNLRETSPFKAGRKGGTPSGVRGFYLPSTSKFSMLEGMQLTMNLLLAGAHIQASPCRPVCNPGC